MTMLPYSLGTHLFVDFHGCKADLDSPNTLMNLALQAVEKSGAAIVGTLTKQFDPQGVSGVILIAESHLAWHSWPEYDTICFDYFTCGNGINPQAAIEFLMGALSPDRIAFSSKQRGLAYDAKDQENPERTV